MILLRLIRHLAYRWNRVRNRWRIFGLRMCGIQVGRNVYIGRRVEFHVSPGAAVTIGNDCVINDYTAFFIGPSASLSIGPRTYIGRFCGLAINAQSSIGSDCALAAYCTVIDSDHVLRADVRPNESRNIVTASVQIGDEVWMGYKVTVLKGVQLGKHCVVAANAVVSRSIPSHAVAAGVPARVIKTLDAAASQLRGEHQQRAILDA